MMLARPRLIEHIIRRWWVIVAGIAVGLIVAIIYLLTATPLYTVTSILSLDHRIGIGGDVKPDEFFKTQRDLILSDAVLTAAIDSLDLAQRAQLVGFAHSSNALRDSLTVRTSLSEQVIAISLQCPAPRAGAQVVNAVTAAYFKARGGHGSATANDLAELTKQSDARAADRLTAEKALAEYRAAANVVGTNADRAALDQLNQLTTGLAAAEKDLAQTNAAIASCKELVEDPVRREETIEASRSKGIFGGLDLQKKQIDNELSKLEPQLERQKQTMSPQHPMLQAAIMKVEQLKQRRDALDKQYVETYRTYLEQQRAAAQKKIDSLKTLVAVKSKESESAAAKSARLAELEAKLKAADAAQAEADAKLNQIKVNAADTGPRIGIALAATAPLRPTHPDRVYCLSSALIVGLAGGLVLAAMGRSRR
jgi:succinoglycan biosynthesis transport protein ExoP